LELVLLVTELSEYMRLAISFCVLILLWCAALIPSTAQQRYFPEKVFAENPDSNEYRAGPYSKILWALNEPSLYQESKSKETQSYRFRWLRTFHQPLSLRFDLKSNGMAMLTIKKAGGKGAFHHRSLSPYTSI
jgi:hypothetical protein